MSTSHGIERVDPFGEQDEPVWTASPALPTTLPDIRATITELDARLITLLSDRIRVGKQAHLSNASTGQAVFDPESEAAIIRQAATKASASGLDTEAIQEIFGRIVRMTREASEV